jgi:hypothetical protein
MAQHSALLAFVLLVGWSSIQLAAAETQWTLVTSPAAGITDVTIATASVSLRFTNTNAKFNSLTKPEVFPGLCTAQGNSPYGFNKWKTSMAVAQSSGNDITVTIRKTPGYALQKSDEVIVCELQQGETNYYTESQGKQLRPTSFTWTIKANTNVRTLVEIQGSVLPGELKSEKATSASMVSSTT